MAKNKINIQLIIEAIAKDKGMKNFANSMKRWTDVNPKGVDKLVDGIQKATESGKGTKGMNAFAQVLDSLAAKGGGASKAIAGVAASAGAAAGPIAIIAAVVGLLVIQVKMIIKVFKRWQKQINNFRENIKDLNQGFRTSLNAFKMLAQGFLTIARSMTFFIATPVKKFLMEGAKAAIGLETALVRVAKVTGDLFADEGDLSSYSEEIRKMAAVSVSSASELAKFSEQLGQMGVRESGPMMELIAIMDVVAASTDIAADNIATDLGAISNAYGYSMAASGDALQEAIKFVDRTAEVVNALENAAGTTASEVVNMLKDVGSTFAGLTSNVDEFGSSLKMNIAQVAGWATIAKELGMSADEVGTALRNLPSYLNDNADKIDGLNISTIKFINSQQFLNGLHTDFYETVDSLVTALADDEDAMNAVAASTDLLGRRSGRLLQNLVKAKQGVQTLSGEFIRYDDIMQEAQKAWEEGGSLMTEYNRMLNSTEVRIKMLRNGFENLSVTIGNDVLPTLNKLVSIATAGALAFSDIFKSIDVGTKRTIGKIVAFAALYGPVSWFLSQTVFGLSMVLQGLTKMGAFIGPLIKLLGTLVGGILTLNPVLILVSATLFGFFNNISGGLSVVSDNIKKFFETILTDTKSWTKAWMQTWAGGIIEGSKAVIQAISTVAKIVASFLEAHSPPERGPLSSIDMWGAVLMNTWLKGFAKADFGILSDVASTVEGILSSIHFTPTGEDDEQERKKIVKDLIKFRENFTKLLKLNRKGVKITDEYLDNLVSGYGSSADEVKELIKAHLELERVQRRLAAIEKERSDITKHYEDQVEIIRLSGASAEEMVESIASAAYERDQNIGALTKEEQILKDREEMFQLQLETQQELMKALQEQSDLWKELIAIQSGAGSGGSLKDLVSGYSSVSSGMDGVLEKAKEAQLRFVQLRLQASKFKEMLFTIIETLKAFWAVVTGQMTLEQAFNPGRIKANVRKALDPNEAKSIVKDYLTVFEEEIQAKDFSGMLANLPEDLRYAFSSSELKTAFNEGLLEMFPDGVPDEARAALDSLFEDLYTDINFEDSKGRRVRNELATTIFGDEAEWEGAADGIIAAVSGPAEAIAGLFTGDFLKNIKGFFNAIGEGMGILDATGDTSKLADIGRTIGEIAAVMLDRGPELIESIGNLSLSLAGWLTALFGGEVEGEGAVATIDALLVALTNIFNTVSNVIDIMVDLKNALSDVKSFIQKTLPFGKLLSSAWTLLTRLAAIWSLLRKIAGGGVGSGVGSGGSTTLDDLKTAKQNQGSRRQGGGWLMAGDVARINETGQELFSAPFDGKVTSASLTSKMANDLQAGNGYSKGDINITITNPTVRDDNDIDVLIDTVMYRIAQEV